MNDDTYLSENQFLAPELVMTEMAEVGALRAVSRSPGDCDVGGAEGWFALPFWALNNRHRARHSSGS